MLTPTSTPQIDRTIKGHSYENKGLELELDNSIRDVDLDTVSEQTSLGNDSEQEENYHDDTLCKKGWVADASKPFQQTQEFGINNDLVLPTIDPPEFGDVCIKNSHNVHLGNKTFYKGPVTIKQFIYNNPSVLASTNDDLNCDKVSNEEKFDKTDEVKVNCKENVNDATPNTTINILNIFRKKKWSWTWKLIIFACAIALIILTTSILLVIVSTNSPKDKSSKIYTEETVDGPISVNEVRFVSRTQWGAQPPDEIDHLHHPVPYVIISHTATDLCTTQAQCVYKVRVAQTFHMSSYNWSDIGYNFLVGGDGFVYIGRSWDKVGAHTYGYNSRSIGISFIGTYIKYKPTPTQLNVTQKLIDLGVQRGVIAKDYKLLAHCQVIATESPGLALYKILQTWPHWSENP